MTLANNSISVINSDAFQNLNALDLDLSDNQITTINQHAFRGSVSNITQLNLRNNNLTTLPILLDLKQLQVLDVSGNPIPSRGFNDGVMRHLGSTLREFHFGHKTALNQWPRSTDHLQRLETLDLNGANIYFLPPQSFHGFENRLRSLTVQYTKLTATPILTSLRVLEELHLDHNEFGDYGVLEPTFIGLNLLHTLSLRDDKLTKFPEILKNLPRLTNLALDGNRFYYISDDAVNIIHGTHVSNLSLKDCGLDRVPGSIAGRNLNQLSSLDLGDNNIISIERSDLDGLASLQNISFANNPLRYISTQSLKNLTSLVNFDMSHTKLVTVPKALENLPALNTLDLQNNQIECNCNLMDFQKLQGRVGFSVLGDCETIEVSIINYLQSFIPRCPEYS